MGVDSKKILTALKAGDISLENAKSELLKMAMPRLAMKSREGSRGDADIQKSGTGYHRVITERPGNIDDLTIDVLDRVPLSHFRLMTEGFPLNWYLQQKKFNPPYLRYDLNMV